MAFDGVRDGSGDQAVVGLDEAMRIVYSEKILQEAQSVMNWMPFVEIEEGLMEQSGETIKVTKYNSIHGDALTQEHNYLRGSNLEASEISVKVTEWGQFMPITEKLRRLSWDNLLDQMAINLGRHYAMYGPNYLMQCLAFGYDLPLFGPGEHDSLMQTYAASQDAPDVYFSDAGDIAGGNGKRNDLAAGDIITVDTIVDLVTLLRTDNVPMFNDEFYVMFAHPKVLKLIKQDPLFEATHGVSRWREAHNEHKTGMPFYGEIGRWNDVLFVESPLVPNGEATVNANGTPKLGSQGFEPSEAYSDTGPVRTNGLAKDAQANALIDPNADGVNAENVYRSVIFGANYLTYAEALPVELRQDMPLDFGRFTKLGWYSIFGGDRLEPKHGRIVESTL